MSLDTQIGWGRSQCVLFTDSGRSSSASKTCLGDLIMEHLDCTAGDSEVMQRAASNSHGARRVVASRRPAHAAVLVPSLHGSQKRP